MSTTPTRKPRKAWWKDSENPLYPRARKSVKRSVNPAIIHQQQTEIIKVRLGGHCVGLTFSPDEASEWIKHSTMPAKEREKVVVPYSVVGG